MKNNLYHRIERAGGKAGRGFLKTTQRWLIGALALFVLGGCAATGQSVALDPVPERAKARWAALLSDDLETAYTYYSPGYRSANSVIDFGVAYRLRKVQFTSADYIEHECEESRCTVAFDVGLRAQNPVPGMSVWDGKQKIVETWIKSDGEWWFVPKN